MITSTSKEDTIHTLKNSAQNVRDDARETASETKDDLRNTANKVGRKVRGFVDNAKDEFGHVTESVNTQIHDKPVQSSLIALGVGLLFGMLLSR